MKILWVTNILPHFLAVRLNQKTNYNLGWLDYSAEKLIENKEYKLSVLYPADDFGEQDCGEVSCYTFPSRFLLKRQDDILVPKLVNLLKQIVPDVIHIYGTEYFHTVAVLKAAEKCGLLDQTVVSIQGLISFCAKHYLAGLSYRTTVNYTLRDVLKRENLKGQMKKFVYRGTGETDALCIAKNVIGRTEWDKACTRQINPNRTYYFCNETLRKTFYSGDWNLEHCERHSIFVSQSSYALKGFHQMVEALPLVLKQYPDAKVYVTGGNVFKMKWYRINSYHHYLKKRIAQLGLQDKIVFMGSLNEEKMKERFLNSNVFVSCSSIENSPNSLGEAMILGVPSIASDVGGVVDVFTHNQDGFVYPYDEPYMLAHYICKIFEDKDLAESFSNNAKKHALHTHDPECNLTALCEIYRNLVKG